MGRTGETLFFVSLFNAYNIGIRNLDIIKLT